MLGIAFLVLNKELLKSLLYCLQLGFQVIGIFLLMTIIGLKLDAYFNTKPICILFSLLIAFSYVIYLLVGVYFHERTNRH